MKDTLKLLLWGWVCNKGICETLQSEKWGEILGFSHSSVLMAGPYSFGNNSAATSLGSQRGSQISCLGCYKTGCQLRKSTMGKMPCNGYSSLQKYIKKPFTTVRRRRDWEIRGKVRRARKIIKDFQGAGCTAQAKSNSIRVQYSVCPSPAARQFLVQCFCCDQVKSLHQILNKSLNTKVFFSNTIFEKQSSGVECCCLRGTKQQRYSIFKLGKGSCGSSALLKDICMLSKVR